ncbi:MAG: hypothetical protein SFT92_05015 [Rickettsiales bacterium]|nr:hypothetical protein [Rickettsiales bacterium]
MGDHFNFNQEANLQAMKEDIANRSFKIKVTGMVITGAFMLLAFAGMFMGLGGVAAPLLGLVGAAGGAIAGLVTLKETKKLQIDEEFLQSRMQGKNWWGGYREEVGSGAPAISPHMMPPAPGRGESHQR